MKSKDNLGKNNQFLTFQEHLFHTESMQILERLREQIRIVLIKKFNLFKKKKFPSTVLRLYLAYGPKQDVNRFLPIIIKGCIKNKKFPCSEGVQLRDFTHVDDVVDAILKSLTNKNARGQIINIGSGKPRKIRSVIEDVKKISKGGYPQYGTFKLRKYEILKLYPNIKKAKNKINWEPKISFEKGIKSTIKYYNGQAI